MITFVKLFHDWQYDPYSDPPLGLLSVAAHARKSGLEISLLDQPHQKDIPESEFYGMSATTLEYQGALTQARRIKELYPKAKIIAGGPHFDVLPERMWQEEIGNLPFDVICRGEGEANIVPAIYGLNHGKTNRVINSLGLLNLDSLETPARDLLDREKYFVPGKTIQGLEIAGNSSTIMASRGCGWKCAFCASPMLHKGKVRFRNLKNTISELENMASEYDVTALRWQDDNIPLNIKKFPALVPFLENSGIYSRGSARTDSVNPAMLDLLWQAGFRELGFGIETAEQSVLDYIDKRNTVENNRDALKRTKERGFKTRAFIMTGLPGETKGSAQRMIEFLQDTQPDVVTLTSFIPLPGSDTYNNPSKYGMKIKTKDWNNYDIMLKWKSGVEWTHELENLSHDDMERNREQLKEYVFNTGISNVPIYNKHYDKEKTN